MIDIKQIYNDYLAEKNKLNGIRRENQSEGRFSASSAGLCAKKLWFQKNNYPKSDIDGDSLRVMRLGTIVGNDIDKAMFRFQEGHPDEVKIYSEEYIKDDELGIGGSFDLLLVDKDNKGHLYDYKTCHSYKYSTVFNRKPDPNPSNNYEFQLGTYAMILNKTKQFCDQIVTMEIVYYQKEKSYMRHKPISLDYIDFARTYWEKAIAIAQQDQQPPNNKMAPYYPNWECGKYCSYRDHCDSIYKKELK